MDVLPSSRSQFLKSHHIRSTEHLAVPRLRCLDQRQPMPGGNPALPTPVVDRRHRDADGQSEGFDVRLHAALFAKLANASRLNKFADSAIETPAAPGQSLAMLTTPNEALTSSEMQDGFARRVRQARLAAGYKTQQDLGLAVGMAHSSVSNWERGLQMCHPTDLYRLARALGVTTDWLISGDESTLTIETSKRLNRRK